MSELVERTRRIAESARETEEARRERNRQRYPELAALLDEYRRVFGPGCRVIRVVDDL